MSALHSLASIVDRLHSTNDRDHRFIALKDLHSELSKLSVSYPAAAAASYSSPSSPSPAPPAPTFPLDSAFESRLSLSLLQQLLTSSSELQELTISCLTLLTPLLHLPTTTTLTRSLLSIVLNPDSPIPGARSSTALKSSTSTTSHDDYDDDDPTPTPLTDRRSPATTALQSLIPGLRPLDTAAPIADALLPSILSAVERERTQGRGGGVGSELSLALLSLLSTFLTCHAPLLPHLLSDVLRFLLTLLSPSTSRPTIKAAITCLSSLAIHLPPPLFATLITSITQRYGKGDTTSYLLITSLASSSPAPLTPHSPTLLTLLLSSASSPLPSESSRPINEDREACLIAIEALTRACPFDVLPLAVDVLQVVKGSLCYDPNYVGDEDEDDEAGDEEENGGEEGGEGEGADEAMEGGDGADNGGAEDDAGDEYVEAMSDDEVVDEEDTSGLVRRAASKVVLALLSSASSVLSTPAFSPTSKSKSSLLLHPALTSLTTSLTPLLLSRFHERTSHILIDLLHSFDATIDIARALRLSLGSLLPQPQLNKAIDAVMRRGGGGRGGGRRLTQGDMVLLTHVYNTLSTLLPSLPPNTILSQLHPFLTSLTSTIHTAEKDASTTSLPLLTSAFTLLTSLILHIGPGDWVGEVDAVARLLIRGVRSDRGGSVVEAALGGVEELVEMCNGVGLNGAVGGAGGGGGGEGGAAVDVTFLPMTLLDAACEVESEEERRNSWRLRGEDVLTTAKALASSSLHPKQVAAMTRSTSALVPPVHAAVVSVLQGKGERRVKAAALDTLGLLYSHLPTSASTAAPAGDVLQLLQGFIDSPLTRVEAARAVCRVARCIGFLTPASALHPPLTSLTTSLISYLLQTDRSLQHTAMAALNTFTLRILSISLHQSPDTSSSTPLSTITVLPPFTPLVTTLTSAFPPLHSILSHPAEWMGELDSALILLSHLVLLALSNPPTHPNSLTTVTTDTFPRLLSLVSTLPSSALSYSLSLSIASVYALYYFTTPPSPPLPTPLTLLPTFTSTSSSPPRSRALSMISASSILASTFSSIRGFSEVKAELGWLPPHPLPPPSDREEAIAPHIRAQLQVIVGEGGERDVKTFALGVLGEIGRVHSLSPALYPALLTSLVPVGDAALDVEGAVALGLITIGNPTDFYPHLTSLLSPSPSSSTPSPSPSPSPPTLTSSLALHSLHELLHHLAHHQVVALSHPFNSATVQPHSIPFPSTSLILLIQALSSSITDVVLPLLFTLSTPPNPPHTTHLAINSLTRLMALFPAPTLTSVQSILQRPTDVPLVCSSLDAVASFVSVYLSTHAPPLPSQSIDAHHRHNVVRPKLLPPSTIFTAQLFSLLPFIIPLLTSPSLPLRASSVTLLSAVALHAPQLLTVHLGLVAREWEGFVGREERFVVRKEYGPIVRQVDEALEGRVEGWEMMRQVMEGVEMNAKWYAKEGADDRAAVVASMLRALTKGMDDEPEVAMSALGVVGGVVRSLPLTVEEAAEVVELVRGRVASAVKADAVGAEVTQHEEMVRSAVKVAKELDALVDTDRTLVGLKETEAWRALQTALKSRAQPQPA